MYLPTSKMSIWEQKRKERENQKEVINSTNVSQFSAPVQTSQIRLQAPAPKQSLEALGISAQSNSSVAPYISEQSAHALQNIGLSVPQTQTYQSEKPAYQQQQQTWGGPQQQQRQPQPQYQEQQYQEPSYQQQQKQQNYQQQLPQNTRQQEYDRYQNNSKQLEFNSYQPKPQQITGGEYQQVESKVSPHRKKPSEMTEKEYEIYEKQHVQQSFNRLIKQVIWNPKASNFDKQEAQELLKVDKEFTRLYNEEKRIKDDQDNEKQKERDIMLQQEREKEDLQKFRQEEEERQRRQQKEQLLQQKEQQQQQKVESAKPQKFNPYQTNDDEFEKYQNTDYKTQQPQKPAQYSNSEVQDLRDEIKILREKLRRTELDSRTMEKRVRDLSYDLQNEKNLRIQAERAMLDAQRDMENYRAEISHFQQSIKQGVNYKPNLPQIPQGGYMAKYQPQQRDQNDEQNQYQQNRPQSGQSQHQPAYREQNQQQVENVVQNQTLHQAAKASDPVANILNQANQLLENYQCSDQTLARAGGKQVDQVRQQIKSQQQSNLVSNQHNSEMRTINADSSIIQNSQMQFKNQNDELNHLINQDDNYNTIDISRPPNDIPASLMQTIEQKNIQNRLPSAKYQPQPDPEEIIRKYSSK